MKNGSLLSRMRRYRGRDEAVEIIGDRKSLINLLQDSKVHSRAELVHSIMSCYSGIAYGDSNWQKVTGGWTTPEVLTIYGEFREQYKQLGQLSLNPGFITHLPEFMDYLKSNNIETQDNLKLLEGFKQYLGKKIVWRGMVLTEEEANRARTEGIESDFLRYAKEMPSLIENFEANVLSVYFNELVEVHFHGENFYSPLVSVSSHEDVAVAVGRHFGKRKSPSEKQKELYLFQIEVPEIDLVYYTDHGVNTPNKLKDMIQSGVQLHLSVNDYETSYPWDRETESYVQLKINPEEIIDVSKPVVKRSSWNGKVCN